MTTAPSRKSRSSSGTECFAMNCTNYQNGAKERGLSFHKFPDKSKEPIRHGQWAQNCRRNKPPGSNAKVCSAHFTEDQLDRTGQIVRLREGAIPTMFNLPCHLINEPCNACRTTNSMKATDVEPEHLDQSMETSDKEDSKSGHLDHTYALPREYLCPSGTAIKRKINSLIDKVENQDRLHKNSLAREKRAKKTCGTYLETLEMMNLLSSELSDKMQLYKDIPVDLFRRPANEYSTEQRKLALTLHLYSPKAYEYVRQRLQLPSPRTLLRWLEKLDAEPGILVSMIESLKMKAQEDPDNYKHCCLMLDAMHIKQFVGHDRHSSQMAGYIDLGFGTDSETIASEALVIMAVGLKSRWKAPVAYYLTASLSASTQGQLVMATLNKLQDSGLVVHALATDGHAPNVAMAKDFGCRLDPENLPLKTWFSPGPNSGQRIYVIFDSCHMTKLLRNALHECGVIISPTGMIRWDLFVKLHAAQEAIGLRLANPIGKNHIHYENQKMKVTLAAQILSSSIAKAMRTLKDLGVQGFENCEATVEFTEIVNQALDMFNSRTPFGHGFKQPLRLSNMGYITTVFKRFTDYFLALKAADGKPIWKTGWRLGFICFVVNMESFKALMTDLLQGKSAPLKHILTYKFSQDHLALFFNAVRRGGGWNNNPTVTQLKSTFRKLLARAGACPSGVTGNCQARDCTEMVMAATSTYVPPDNKKQGDEDCCLQNLNDVLGDLDFINLSQNKAIVSNVIVYMAGYVARKVFPRVSCEQCRCVLLSSNIRDRVQSSHCLLTLKNRGGLLVPSTGLIQAVTVGEKCLRAQTGTRKLCPSATRQRFQSLVVSAVGTQDVFGLNNHVLESASGIDNHAFSLLRLVAGSFYDARSHHVARLQKSDLKAKSFRNKLTRSIIFMGQSV